jgi:hypothetical membrane protein
VQHIRAAALYFARHPGWGPAFYALSIQYFLAQLIVAHQWAFPYSLSRNTISDLGNTACGLYGSRLVCSPLHGVMDASFVVLGLTMVLGSAFLVQQVAPAPGTTTGLALMAGAGIGVILVGLFPENRVPAIHGTGAGISFLLGNAGIIVLGWSLTLPVPLRACSFLAGGVALLALGFFVSGHYLGLGEGGLERVVAYPQAVWLIAAGLGLLSARRRRLTLAPRAGAR